MPPAPRRPEATPATRPGPPVSEPCRSGETELHAGPPSPIRGCVNTLPALRQPRMAVSTPQVPFFRPELGDAEIDEVVEVLRSGWLTTGPRTREFEKRFAAAVG